MDADVYPRATWSTALRTPTWQLATASAPQTTRNDVRLRKLTTNWLAHPKNRRITKMTRETLTF